MLKLYLVSHTVSIQESTLSTKLGAEQCTPTHSSVPSSCCIGGSEQCTPTHSSVSSTGGNEQFGVHSSVPSIEGSKRCTPQHSRILERMNSVGHTPLYRCNSGINCRGHPSLLLTPDPNPTFFNRMASTINSTVTEECILHCSFLSIEGTEECVSTLFSPFVESGL